jgi:hypothetical protein
VAVFWAIAPKMEAENISETSINFYQTTRRNNPGNSHFHTRCRENLKSHKSNVLSLGFPKVDENFVNLFFFLVLSKATFCLSEIFSDLC